MNDKNSNKGQALLFVIVILTIALAIGVSVSSRLLSTTSRTTRSDTAARAYAAAEGGIERFLAFPTATLDDVAENNDCQGLPEVDGQCVVVLNDGTGENGDGVVVNAYVRVEKFMYTDEDHNAFEFNLPVHDGREIILDGYTGNEVTICWNSTNNNSYIYYSTYDDNGFHEKGGVTSIGGVHPVDDFDNSTGCSQSSDYAYGRVISLGGNRIGLRLTSLYGDSVVSIFPEAGYDLAYQGHKITSVGRLEMPGEAEVARKVIVYKPYPYLPGIFDFALYSEGDLN